MKIMEEVSKILGLYVTKDTIDREVKILEVSGRFTERKVHELLIMIIKKIHENEKNTSL